MLLAGAIPPWLLRSPQVLPDGTTPTSIHFSVLQAFRYEYVQRRGTGQLIGNEL